eukprot:CAMPEP_0204045054 /NCGR_PEP_ID=MMETSP0360-20130528/106821_1 /ASSEMBLY_ACC=CAM_ASM_000342 /TAXON_ID=268821 /ORGANISM="Scrippsiella Hangoei, Strain SHTV-5" /LENGTH=42 /DNA_ID= /DNA_START= /DNA_END= /DNA_ORIENTATION=
MTCSLSSTTVERSCHLTMVLTREACVSQPTRSPGAAAKAQAW